MRDTITTKTPKSPVRNLKPKALKKAKIPKNTHPAVAPSPFTYEGHLLKDGLSLKLRASGRKFTSLAPLWICIFRCTWGSRVIWVRSGSVSFA